MSQMAHRITFIKQLKATQQARGVTKAAMRQKRSRAENWAPAKKRAERRQRKEQRPEQREQSPGRDEILSATRHEMQSACRDETRLKKKREAKENASNDRQTLELLRRAWLYRKSETAALVLHVESELHKHANKRRKKRTSSAFSFAHSSSSRARLHMARACDNIAYTIIWFYV